MEEGVFFFFVCCQAAMSRRIFSTIGFIVVFSSHTKYSKRAGRMHHTNTAVVGMLFVLRLPVADYLDAHTSIAVVGVLLCVSRLQTTSPPNSK